MKAIFIFTVAVVFVCLSVIVRSAACPGRFSVRFDGRLPIRDVRSRRRHMSAAER